MSVEHVKRPVVERQNYFFRSSIAGIRKLDTFNPRGQVNRVKGRRVGSVVKKCVHGIGDDLNNTGPIRAVIGLHGGIIGSRHRHLIFGGITRDVIVIVIAVQIPDVIGVLPPPEAVVPETPAVIIRVIPPPTTVEIPVPEEFVSRIPAIPMVAMVINVMAIVESAVLVPIVLTGLVFASV